MSKYCGMDVLTLRLVLRPILNVTSVWNTRETGDTNRVIFDGLTTNPCDAINLRTASA